MKIGDKIKITKAMHAKQADEIKAILYDQIFRPIIDISEFTDRDLFNDNDDLLRALRAGEIIYKDGAFRGKFSASITKALRKIGAEYGRVAGQPVYKLKDISSTDLSAYRSAILVGTANAERLLTNVEGYLEALSFDTSNFDVSPSSTIDQLNKKISKSLNKMGIEATSTTDIEEQLTKRYIENVNLSIKKASNDTVIKLRKKIAERGLDGTRAESFVDMIRKELKASEKRAAFIARQETGLLVSKYKEENYKRVGIRRYVWDTTGNNRVREDHESLDGQIFSWDNPPISNQSEVARGLPARYNHPGEDFRCFCVARPLVDESS
jgi:SPP1 gp7 family putative phage head morphogenesis protein